MAKIHDSWGGSLPEPPTQVAICRIWIDGCFDSMHFGHVRLFLMAQDIGHVVIVGVHSDAEVERVKGPTLMTLCERVTVLSSCRWISEIVPCAPYTTSLSWVDHVGAQLAIHGDDIALDDDGLDSLADVKKTGRFRLVKRRKDPGAISTTKIIDRILHPNTRHHLPKANFQTFNGSFGLGAGNGQVEKPDISMLQKLELLAGGGFARHDSTTILDLFTAEKESFVKVIVSGKPPAADQRVVYLDGAFDLFTAGHASLLKAVAVKDQATYHSHEPYTMVGLYDDVTIATCKGQGFPVMNMFERAFLLLQCRYVNAVILSAPLRPTLDYLCLLRPGGLDAVYYGAVAFGKSSPQDDRYDDVRGRLPFIAIDDHPYHWVTTDVIQQRVLGRRGAFEVRQQTKGQLTA